MSKQERAEELKNKGNTALKAGKIQEAISHYTEAIELDPENHVFYSNRSAAYIQAKKFHEALDDAEKAIELKPDFAKGYSRKGAALTLLQKYMEAEDAYREGLKIDPESEVLKKGLQDSQNKKMEDFNPFKQRDAFTKLTKDPKTASFMKDPNFKKGLEELARDQNALPKYMNDSRYVAALGVLLGVDLQQAPPEEDPFVEKPQSSSESSSPKTEKAEEKPDEPKENGLAEDKKAALEEKEKGNSAYKKKEFEVALVHYDKAIQLDPSNITFLTNKAAVYYEQEDDEKCIETCELAVEKGRETRADFKLIAKALARAGNVHFRKKRWDDAIRYFDKSLAEHRNPDVVTKKNTAQKNLKEEEKLAYIDENKSQEAKAKGNEFYQLGKFADAIQMYNEAIKRNPEDAKIYSNRAACYHKLTEWQLALKDCDECIRLDPGFIKGYIRRGQALLALKEVPKAMAAFQKALEIDPQNFDAREGLKKCYASDDPETRRKMAMQDPEVQKVMMDPAMQMILQQMQDNPDAIREHLKNPEIAAKIEKLIDSGIISFRPK